MVEGVTKGFEKKHLKIEGNGYQATAKTVGGKKGVELTVGFANKILRIPPEGVRVEVPDPTTELVKGRAGQASGRPVRRGMPGGPKAGAVQAARACDTTRMRSFAAKEGKSFASGG